MGLLEITGAVVPIALPQGPVFAKRWMKLETVSCKHCQKILAVYNTGCSRYYQSDRTCQRCDGFICKGCAEGMAKNGGECPGPFIAKVEEAIRTGQSLTAARIREFRYRYRGP